MALMQFLILIAPRRQDRKELNPNFEYRNSKQIMDQIRNPNFEIRNNTKIQITKILNYSIR